MVGNEAVVCGYAKLPSGTAAGQVYQMLVLVARVDRRTHIVQAASITLITPVAREWVESILLGSHLVDGQVAVLDEFETNYNGGAQKAIKQAYRDLCERYAELPNAPGQALDGQ
ncbi:MAG TPA: DUF3870 domain-containing protein [Thermoleophilia bacterium]|nr:DUF3870 domain-containing protein [Thermoleophilia bacterium]